ncbi:MAG: hypothetical protein ACFHX7_12520 [Pseudomonadota bacterium]
MDVVTLRQENKAFRGTRGVSRNNRNEGFKPAFLDKKTGRIEVARLADGAPAPMHVISWLPREWAVAVDRDGAVLSLIPTVIAGFVRDDVFYTREEVAEL